MSKKLLIASTALTLAVAGASFAKFEAKINGDYKNGIAYVTTSDDADGEEFQSFQDYEFNINSKYEMDNGITAFFKLEFDAQTDDEGQFDDVETGFSGDFGLVRFGNFGGDDAFSSVAPTETSIFQQIGYNNGYPFKSGTVSLPSVGLNNNGTDANAVMYVSPSIAGFKAVARYTFSDSQVSNSAAVNEKDETQNQQIGLGYSGSFGGAKVRAGGYYSNSTVAEGSVEWMISGNVEMSGAGLTVMYADYSNDTSPTATTDETSYVINPYYKTGPWKITASYAVEDIDGGNKETGMGIGASYAMGPGVSLGIQAVAAEVDSATAGTDDEDGTQVTAGFVFNF